VFTCWDTGSELDAIAPEFGRAIGLSYRQKETPLRIRLGTKGTLSSSSYKADVQLGFGKTNLDYPLYVVNLDRWDMILGANFCDKYGVILNFGSRTIKFSDTVLKVLAKDKEAAVRQTDAGARRSKAVTAKDGPRAHPQNAGPQLAALGSNN